MKRKQFNISSICEADKYNIKTSEKDIIMKDTFNFYKIENNYYCPHCGKKI